MASRGFTPLVRSLTGAGYPLEDFALFFDLEEAKFIRARGPGDIRDTWLPMTEVVDSEQLLEWIFAHPKVDRRRAIRVGKRVREYQLPAYLVRTKDEDAVRQIFSRLNRRGKRMEDHDVFTALYGAKGGASPADIHDVARELAADDAGFGAVPSKLLHSMLLATLTTDVSKDRTPKLDDTEAQAAIEALSRSARSVIHFLLHDAKIPQIALLPYTQPLVTLSRFFAFNPEPHRRSRELLARWVWRGALSGQHQGDTISVRKTLEAIDGDEHGSVQRLLRTLPVVSSPDLPLTDFRFRHAKAKILTLALWSASPRDLRTGEVIDVRAPQLFPPASITSSLAEGHLANRIIHPPIDGSRTLRAALATVSDPVILRSHVLDRTCVELLAAKQVEAFCERRSALLNDLIADFVRRHARIGDNDRPPLEALIVDDEPDEDELEEAPHGA